MPKTLLIDADILAYRFSAQTESSHEWEPGIFTYHGDIPAAVRSAGEWIEWVKNILHADDFLLCFSCKKHRYFRHDLLPTYKSHRTQGRPPVHRHGVEAALKEKFPSKEVDHLEADDVLGILATWADWKPGHDKIIVSEDKDLLSVPGLHFNPRDMDLGIFVVPEAEADLFHLTQTLTGDVCDGFKGLPGIGPKKAAKILALDNFPVFADQTQLAKLRWLALVEAYEKRGLTEADALVQARVARILRASDWDFANKKVILWNPSAASLPS